MSHVVTSPLSIEVLFQDKRLGRNSFSEVRSYHNKIIALEHPTGNTEIEGWNPDSVLLKIRRKNYYSRPIYFIAVTSIKTVSAVILVGSRSVANAHNIFAIFEYIYLYGIVKYKGIIDITNYKVQWNLDFSNPLFLDSPETQTKS